MADLDLFTEIFPIAVSPQLAAYVIVHTDACDAAVIGGRLAFRLWRTFPGYWLWSGGRILTDNPRAPVELSITLDIARSEQPDLYGCVESLDEDPRWQPTPENYADFIARTYLRDLEDELRRALARPDLRVPNARIVREPHLQTWVIDSVPSVSLSIRSRLIADQDLAAYAAGLSRVKSRALTGLMVADKTGGLVGEITGTAGKLGQHRDRLLKITQREVMQRLIMDAPDDELMVRVQSRHYEYEYITSALNIVLRTDSLHDDLERFEIDIQQARRALQMKPAQEAQLVKLISDMAKEAGLILNAYNSREVPGVFLHPHFEANLVFDKNRVRPYNARTLGDDFNAGGLYRRHPAFASSPIRIAAINTLSSKIDDFMEAMKRQLERQFRFSIELIRERKVKVLSYKNLTSAVKVIENEDAHIVLVFVPDEDGELTADATASYLKSLVMGKGIASHVIREAILDQPEAMTRVIMGVLGKTGSVPFVLAEPLVYAQYIVGLDIVREVRKDEAMIAAIARIYRSDGMFLRYVIREMALETENMLYVLMRDLFPQRDFAGKRVIIHYPGELSAIEREVLAGWAQALGAAFYPVEILSERAPHLYALHEGKIAAPPWGSAFRVSETEAFLVSSSPDDDTTPQPLLVRTTLPLTIEQALHSVLVWTMLHYGAFRPPRLPVTVQYSDVIAQELAKGALPEAQDGAMPFWL